ncbi:MULTISPECIES: isoamylase early set domain-containing protein [Klenkia]|uniref:Glycogen recognition site of AMP-activated protein kinase n=1 Tax=Klenkia brasiliensis TaxID=333142 RepID=A0A1G7SNC3_9ACTN|nr:MULTISPECIES: isoamylase early set domain-containing protein [Klenkia]MCO7220737.1 isoamylase early set domain-containing protein [Klenkia sp. PcliD-1-E]SDG24555.1 Glycogen recognition site of AMP-activated protein kinase [Klenkia brasiliensis]
MIRLKKSPSDVAVTFALEEQAVPGPVSVVGDFNGWTPGTHTLKKRSNGTRSVVVKLPAGEPVRFRYLADGGVWLDDPTAHAHDEQGSLLHL